MRMLGTFDLSVQGGCPTFPKLSEASLAISTALEL